MQARLRLATKADSDAMYDITTSVHLSDAYKHFIPEPDYQRFLDRYTPSDMRRMLFYQKIQQRLRDPSWGIWVADYNSTTAGFISFRSGRGYTHIKELFVLGKYQSLGLGRQLFDRACLYAQPNSLVYVDLIHSNERAMRLYVSAGFVVQDTGKRKKYYGARIIRMAKCVTSA